MVREMKASGVEWIGSIPQGWMTSKNKYLLEEMYSGGTPTASNETLYTDDGIPFVSISDMSNSDYVTSTKKHLSDAGLQEKNLRILAEGTILYSIYATIGAVSELRIKAAISQAMLALSLRPGFDKQYYKYNLLAMKDYIFFSANGNTQFNLNAEKVWNFSFVVPSLKEQQRISEFLDRKCAEIDELIAQTQKTIEEYKKLKQSIITEAVTKGIRPGRAMKDSGIEWVGEIPAEWDVKKLKFIADFVQVKYDASDGNLNYIGLENVTGWNGQYIDTSSEYDREQSLICEAGDILFGKLRPYLAKVYISPEKQCCSGEFAVLRVSGNNRIRFFWYQLISHGFVFMVDRSTYGTKMPRANADFIKNIGVSVPTITEQDEIVQYLDSKCIEMDRLINSKQQLFIELESYKKSLIYEYVTGKKEV